MCYQDDLRAQARATSGDVMRVMGGVAGAAAGLLGVGIALAIGWANHEIEPFRVVANVATLTTVIGVVVGGFAWLRVDLSKQIRQSSCSCHLANSSTVTRLDRAGI